MAVILQSKGPLAKLVVGNQFILDREVIAEDVSIADAGEYYDSDNVEGALQEVGADIVEIFDLLATETLSFEPVISQLNTPPISPTLGDRYLVNTAPTGAWVGYADNIAEWDGSAWVFTAPILNYTVFLTNTATTLKYSGSAWIAGKAVPILQNGNNLGNVEMQIGPLTGNSLVFLTGGTTAGRLSGNRNFLFGTLTGLPYARATASGANNDTGGFAVFSTVYRLAIHALGTLDTAYKAMQAGGVQKFLNSVGGELLTISETLVNALVPIRANRYESTIQTLTISGGLIAWNMALGQRAKVTLTENATLSNPTNATAAFPDLEVLQDGTGGWLLSFDSDFVLPVGYVAPPTMLNTYTLYHFQLRSDGKFAVVATHYAT